MDSAPATSRQSAGFTLIEMMVVVAIVGVLLLVAIPAYQTQMIHTHRAAAQAEMLRIASLQQQHLLSDRAYMDVAALEAAGFVLEAEVSRHYDYTIALGTGSTPTYQLTFLPRSAQLKDGPLGLDEQGRGTPAGKWP